MTVLRRSEPSAFTILNAMQSAERQKEESLMAATIPSGFHASVPAVNRAIAVLDAIAAASEPSSLAALTSMLGYPKSSLLGICNTLVSGGLLQRTKPGHFRLGSRIVGLAHAYLSKSNVTELFFETWDALDALRGETVVLSVLDGAEVVYVACRNGTQGLTFNYRIGMRLPASCSASGKAMLSTLPRQTVEELFSATALRQLTPHSLLTFDALSKELDTVRKRGFAIDDQEVREGMCCIGAPIFEMSGNVASAAIAMSLLSGEFKSKEKYDKAVEIVTRFADELSRRLGGERSVSNNACVRNAKEIM
jgi:DNA-binding IclR family transcriptional regulator